MHNTLKKWGELELVTSDSGLVTSDQLLLFSEEVTTDLPSLTEEKLQDLWHSSFIVQGYESRVEADMARLKGEKLLRFFYDWWKQEEHIVLLVEKGFSIELEGKKLSGRFDRVEQVEGGLKVIDYKTSTIRTQEQVDADLQLSVYALACEESLGQPCKELSFLFLSEEGVTEVITERMPSHLKDAVKQISGIEERIAEGNFHPTPSREVCRGCPYKGVCDAASV